MQTIEEYKAYTRQLEEEVGKWHHAYDALVIERNTLVSELEKFKTPVTMPMPKKTYPLHPNQTEQSYNAVELPQFAFDEMVAELEELRKHEVAWDTDKAQIKVYEQRLAEYEEIDKARMKYINDCEKACKEMAAKIAALETELEQNQN